MPANDAAPGVNRLIAQLFLNPQKLIVLREPIGS
jgi:hypothetical protein